MDIVKKLLNKHKLWKENFQSSSSHGQEKILDQKWSLLHLGALLNNNGELVVVGHSDECICAETVNKVWFDYDYVLIFTLRTCSSKYFSF